MTDRFRMRRTLLKSAVLGVGAAVPLTSGLKTLFGRPLKLRIAISNWLPDALVQDFQSAYLVHLIRSVGQPIETVTVPNQIISDQLRHGSLDGFDAFFTAPTFHASLSPEHVYFGSLPFGLSLAQKSRWLFSSEGLRYQNNFFAPIGLRPQLLALGSDSIGVFSKRPIQAAIDFRKTVIAMHDLRSHWFKKYGARSRKLNPHAQVREMNAGQLDISEPLAPLGSSLISARLVRENDWTYSHFPQIRTAASIFLLWRKSAWGAHFQNADTDTIWADGFKKISENWQARESEAMRAISQRHSVQKIPSQVVELFRPDALAYRQLLARQNSFADNLTTAYNRAANGDKSSA